MSKPMGVTLPAVLLLLDFWPLKRIGLPGELANSTRNDRPSLKSILLEKTPFGCLSALACVLTVRAQDAAIVSTAGLPFPSRLAHALVAYVHYAAAMFWPVNLSVYYPYNLKESSVVVGVSAATLALVTMAALWNLRKRPWLALGWFWFLGTLVPVIGLVQVGDQAWADRYTYLPLTGLFLAIIWQVNEAVKNRALLATCSVALALLLLGLTTLQIQTWRSTTTLFDHARKVTENNCMAWTILGGELAAEGKLDEAMENYAMALQISPSFPEAHFFLANALEKKGRLDEAIVEYKKSLWFRPTQEQTHIFIGMALGKQNKYAEAAEHYREALKLNPESAVAENNLARLLHTEGNLEEAVRHYRAALAINPKLALAHNNLGILLLQQGDPAGGTTQLRQALALNPTNSETQFNLAVSLCHQGQWNEAVELFTKTVGSANTDANAHFEFAKALEHTGETRRAMSHYASTLLARPDFPDALDGLAWILCTSTNAEFREGGEALKMSTRAVELAGRNDAMKLKTLAAAQAEAGDFEKALAALNEAENLAVKSSNTTLVETLKRMRTQFQIFKPWRE